MHLFLRLAALVCVVGLTCSSTPAWGQKINSATKAEIESDDLSVSDSKRVKTFKRPNIVFLLADDLDNFMLPSYGGDTDLLQGSWDTPHIDRLVEKGMKFTQAHAMPMCLPTRTQLMAGKYNVRFGHRIPDEMSTMPQLLKKFGYRTGISGKWMIMTESYHKGVAPLPFGFDEALIQLNGYKYWTPPYAVWNSGGLYREKNQPEGVAVKDEWDTPVGTRPGEAFEVDGGYGPEILCDFACDFIRRNSERDQPFFLYYPFKLPHHPLERTPETEDERPYKGLSGKLKDKTQAYLPDVMRQIDKNVGRVIDTLETVGVLENTLLVFTSDNGNDRGKPLDDRPWSGKKGTPLEGGTRVPLIIHWPAAIKPGSECHDLISFTDFLPTFVDASGGGLPSDEIFDGVSFLPQLLGQKGAPREHIYFHGGTAGPVFQVIEKQTGVRPYYADPDPPKGFMWRWVRGQRYKLYGDGRFFDMHEDLKETRPIAPGTGSPEAEAARVKLQAVLDKFDSGRPEPSFWDGYEAGRPEITD